MKYNENTNGAQIILKMSLRTNDDGKQKKYESETNCDVLRGMFYI